MASSSTSAFFRSDDPDRAPSDWHGDGVVAVLGEAPGGPAVEGGPGEATAFHQNTAAGHAAAPAEPKDGPTPARHRVGQGGAGKPCRSSSRATRGVLGAAGIAATTAIAALSANSLSHDLAMLALGALFAALVVTSCIGRVLGGADLAPQAPEASVRHAVAARRRPDMAFAARLVRLLSGLAPRRPGHTTASVDGRSPPPREAGRTGAERGRGSNPSRSEAHGRESLEGRDLRRVDSDEEKSLRRHRRIRPQHTSVSVVTDDGRRLTARILDLSRSGVALEGTMPGVWIGSMVTVGARRAKAVRMLPRGMALEFSVPIPANAFDALTIL